MYRENCRLLGDKKKYLKTIIFTGPSVKFPLLLCSPHPCFILWHRLNSAENPPLIHTALSRCHMKCKANLKILYICSKKTVSSKLYYCWGLEISRELFHRFHLTLQLCVFSWEVQCVRGLSRKKKKLNFSIREVEHVHNMSWFLLKFLTTNTSGNFFLWNSDHFYFGLII